MCLLLAATIWAVVPVSGEVCSLEPLPDLPQASTTLEKRIASEYGAMWHAQDHRVQLPATLVFEDAAQVKEFQDRANLRAVQGMPECNLQAPAAEALEKAMRQAARQEIKISPRGEDACLRSYEQTVALWRSRVEPNLERYLAQGDLNREEADALRNVSRLEQVGMILDLERKRGLMFGKYRRDSILRSVAAPGTSQHLSGLAFDLAQFDDQAAVQILQAQGWYRTISGDTPHFTYLGATTEEALLKSGLRRLERGSYTYWVPADV
jgi:LAS superfamily LD-carboxypeptidase LdcB